MLKHCIKLIEVDKSIGEIKTLIVAKSEETSKDSRNMKSLMVLSLDETAIYESNSLLSNDVMLADLSYLPSLKSLNL
ncbi:hypothetical protein QQP08_020110, partial [Theobroma cacao]